MWKNWTKGQRRLNATNQNDAGKKSDRAERATYGSGLSATWGPTGQNIATTKKDEDWWFKIRRKSTNQISVTSGYIEHNGIKLTVSSSYFLTNTSNDRYAVYICTSRNDSNYDPQIVPNQASIQVKSGATAGFESQQFDGKRTLIGFALTNKNSQVRQIIQVPHPTLDKYLETPDTNSRMVSDTPWRKTLERNYNPADEHYGEWQLTDCDTIPAGEYGIPFLPLDSSGNGTLDWLQPDADVGGLGSGTRKSIRRVATDELEINKFRSASDAGAMATNDLFGFKDVDADEFLWVSYGTVRDKVVSDISTSGLISSSVWVHDELDGTPGSSGALGVAVGHTDFHWVQGRGHSYNFGEGIGAGSLARGDAGGSSNRVINLLGRSLIGAGQHWNVQSSNRFQVLNNLKASSSSGALEVTGGGLFNAGVYAIKGGADLAGYFTDGTRYAGFADGTQAGAFSDGTDTVLLSQNGYGVEVTAGAGINILDAGAYHVGATAGVTVGSWAKKGIVISQSEFNTYLENKVNDILGGHGLI